MEISPTTSCLCYQCITVAKNIEKNRLDDLLFLITRPNDSLVLPYKLNYILMDDNTVNEEGGFCSVRQKAILFLLNVPEPTVFVSERQEVTKAAFAQHRIVYLNNKLQAKLSVNVALVAKLDWTSKPIQQWTARKRI